MTYEKEFKYLSYLSNLLGLQCPGNPTTKRSVFGDVDHYETELKMNSDDPRETGEQDRPTRVEQDDRT